MKPRPNSNKRRAFSKECANLLGLNITALQCRHLFTGKRKADIILPDSLEILGPNARYEQQKLVNSICKVFAVSMTLAGLVSSPVATATTAPAPDRSTTAHVAPSNDISNGEPFPLNEVPAWAAVIVTEIGHASSACTGSFLSTRFVITAEHCLWGNNDRQVSPNKLTVATPGNFQAGSGALRGATYKVQSYYIFYGADIAILGLMASNDAVKNFPIFHNYQGYIGEPAVMYGTSRLAGGETNEWRYLFRGTSKLTDLYPLNEKFFKPMYIGYPDLPQPANFPPLGNSQPGDSGGPVLAELLITTNSQSVTPIKKVMAIIHGAIQSLDGLTTGTTSAALDDDALDWIGRYVGLIRAPGDDMMYYGDGHIDIEVSSAVIQPITDVALFDESQTRLSSCTEFKTMPNNNKGCTLPTPLNDGLYTIRAFREDLSYDEVHIEYCETPPEEGSGLRIGS